MAMKNKYLLLPAFLDAPLPALDALMPAEWERIQPSLPEGGEMERIIALNRALRDRVAETALKGIRPICVAGDCVTTLGVLTGLQEAGLTPTLLWLDAHGDFNTWDTTPSGFLGGMPLAMLVGRGDQEIVTALGLRPLKEQNVILSDARDLDPGERQALESSKVRYVPDATDLLTMPLPPGPLHVHFDTDIIDAAAAPAMSYPVPGGPSPALLIEVFRRLAALDRVAAISFSAWNPDLDSDGSTGELCLELLSVLAGEELAA